MNAPSKDLPFCLRIKNDVTVQDRDMRLDRLCYWKGQEWWSLWMATLVLKDLFYLSFNGAARSTDLLLFLSLWKDSSF